MVESDEELVQRTRRGDREAFAGLVERYEQSALLVAGSVLHSWHDARDAVQDSFVTAYERLNRLWSPHKFGAWFLRIVRRQALWQARRQASRSRRLVPITPEQACAPESEGEISADLVAMIARLPRQECVVVTLRHLSDLPVADIARITGRPVGTVTRPENKLEAVPNVGNTDVTTTKASPRFILLEGQRAMMIMGRSRPGDRGAHPATEPADIDSGIKVDVISIKGQDQVLIVTTVVEDGATVWAEAATVKVQSKARRAKNDNSHPRRRLIDGGFRGR